MLSVLGSPSGFVKALVYLAYDYVRTGFSRASAYLNVFLKALESRNRTLLGTPLSCMVKPLESRDVCRSEFIPIEPCHHTYHINRGSNAKMLQVRFGQTAC